MATINFSKGTTGISVSRRGVPYPLIKILAKSPLFSFLWHGHPGIYAQDEFPDTQPYSNTDEILLFEEIPSVYSASKYEQKITNAPASVSIVTAEEIKTYGYRTFGALLSNLKKFYNTNDRNYRYAGARDFGLPSDYNTRLLLPIDGHRFNDNILVSFDTSYGFPVDIDNIERVEIVRGPASSLYGTNAFFGVINIITRKGRSLDGIEMSGAYGSFNAYNTRLNFGEHYASGLEMFQSGGFYDSRGNNRLYYQEFDDPPANNGIFVHNDEEQAKHLLGKISFTDFTLQGVYVRRKKDVPTASFNTLFNHPATNTIDESYFIDLTYEQTFANQLNLQTRLSYNHYRFTGDYPYDYSEDAPPFIVVNKDLSQERWRRSEAQISKLLFGDHFVTVGGEFQHHFAQFQTNYDLETYILSEPSTYRRGLFIQDDHTINESFSLNLVLRYDYFSIFGDTLNPGIGLTHHGAEKLLYGTTFRAPTQYELSYHDNGSTTLPSDNLKPEELATVEWIFEHYFGRQLRAEFNLFYTSINDIISLIELDNGLLQNQNIGDIESKGAKIQLEGNWINGYQGRISYSWQETLYAGYETRYMSCRNTPSSGSDDSHVVSNLTIFSQHGIEGLELSAGVYNLFDQRYFYPGSSEHKQNDIDQDRLTLRIKANLQLP